MKNIILFLIISCCALKSISQEKTATNTLLKELSENSCKCIDQINVFDKTNKTVSQEINTCIKEQVNAYQLGAQLMQIDTTASNTKEVTISINDNEESDQFKKYYYEIERYLVENCNSLKKKIASFDKKNDNSISDNPEALAFYNKGIAALKKENFKKGIGFFKKAIKIDPNFSFAWDNLGISYRKLNKYDEAIAAYEASLKIDPNGFMPLQNIAIVYQYKKEYKKAIKTYKKLAKLDDKNPEIYYGIGRIYAANLNDYEKGLDNMCKAYNLYVALKSPYRTDAEKVISIIYNQMKEKGKEETFNKILKQHNISH